MIKCLESYFVYVCKLRTKTSQVSRTFKLQEKKLKFSEAQLIEE